MNVRTDAAILAHANTVVSLHGCEAIELSADSTGVKGDARARGPTVIVRFPAWMPAAERQAVANEVTNTVGEITRVLSDETARMDPP